MKIAKLKQRLQKDRPITSIELRLPEDVVEDLKQVAAVREFLDYRALMQALLVKGCGLI
jgi:predicted DNA binding CopG/RHH family protein